MCAGCRIQKGAQPSTFLQLRRVRANVAGPELCCSTVVCDPVMLAGVHTARFRVLKVGAAASPIGEPVVTIGVAHSIEWDESAVVGIAQRTVSPELVCCC